MKGKWLIFFFGTFVLTGSILGQPARPATCYSEKSLDVPGSEVFKKTEFPPKFREHGFKNYLELRIPFAELAAAMPGNTFTDTAQVKFILSPYNGMSDLTVTKTPDKRFQNELVRVMKESACLWSPGGFSGREVTSWVVLNIYYTVKRGENKDHFAVNVGYDLVNKIPLRNGQ
ncbi:hypothetical protein [Niabella sp.]|uniref:hypothetical protein n=1 Tax=Niabella sp. TaxID=1962976 RepID=UPI00262720F3|nr:hypothetical protein [Niabella sp.]